MRKHLKYLRYVLLHKWFVFLGCCRMGIPWRGLVHDLSKLRPSEWNPYTNYFYGAKDAMTKADFDTAWLHHIHRNPHHWQHWVLREDEGDCKVMEMPEVFMKELVADWVGANRVLSGGYNILKWYAENRDKIHFHPRTRQRVEEMIGWKQT